MKLSLMMLNAALLFAILYLLALQQRHAYPRAFAAEPIERDTLVVEVEDDVYTQPIVGKVIGARWATGVERWEYLIQFPDVTEWQFAGQLAPAPNSD